MEKCIKKTITYRILAILSNILIAWFLGLSIEVATLLGILIEGVHTLIYYVHEKFWVNK